MHRLVHYVVDGQNECMDIADRYSRCTSCSDARTFRNLSRDLRGEPFVPEHFVILVLMPGCGDRPPGWYTERTLRGQLPVGSSLRVRIVPKDPPTSCFSFPCG